MKRIVSMIAAICIAVSVLGIYPIHASNIYDEENGIYEWSFTENTQGPCEIEDGMFTIKLANVNDTVKPEGIGYNGGNDIQTVVEELPRYIKVTPESAGIIKVSDSNKRLKIAKEGQSSSIANSNNSDKTLSAALEAGNTYYIYPTGQTKITKIIFESENISKAESLLKDRDSITFSFGNADIENTQKVTDNKYFKSTPYGFTENSGIVVNDTDVTSSSDFTFNVLVPDGNYEIELDTTAQTLSYEQIPNITYATRIRKFKDEKKFTAAVCDGVLDITIPKNETISSLSVTKQAVKNQREKPALFAVGDSTVNTTETNSSHPERGESCTWGVCVDNGSTTLPNTISAFYNCGQAGANTITYYNDYEHENIGHLDDVLLNICPGDYVTVNLGINNKRDKSKTGTETDITDTSAYETIVRDYICGGIIQRGGIPVILTATPHGPIDSYEKCYDNGMFSCERTGSDARTSTLLGIAKELNLDVIDVGAWGNSYFNSLRAEDIGSADNVLSYVQNMYIDHNHYKQALGEKIANYILTSVSNIILSKKEITDGIETSVTLNVDNNIMEIDTSSLPANNTVSEYEITLSKNGRKLQSFRTPASNTVYAETIGADKIDVCPVYNFGTVSGIKSTNKKLGDFENGLYNITVGRSDTVRYDVYINDSMIGNNINQGHSKSNGGRGGQNNLSYTANNVSITTGEINIKMEDSTGSELNVEIVKAPPSVNRRTKIFVIGDSLVCNYYGGDESKILGQTQTGWGQVFEKFVNKDKYEVVNLANSGETAKGLHDTAISGVLSNGQAGDILLFEAGYNDAAKSNEKEMAEAASDIVDKISSMRIIPILLNPNATPEEYSSVVRFGDIMKNTAENKKAKFIDLSKLTYNYLYSLYGSNTSDVKATLALNTSDDTHTSYLGAMKYASIIANEIYKEYKENSIYSDMIDTDYMYSKSDDKEHTIVCNALEDVSEIKETEITATATFNNMYGSNMLLQRDKTIKLDGTAENAESVTVALTKDGDTDYKNSQTVYVKDGKWNVNLDAVTLDSAEEYQNAVYTLTVTPVSGNEKTECKTAVLTNIKFGDLYLCGGQSNMWYHLNRYIGIDYNEADINNYSNENIRIMQEPTTDDGASKDIVFIRKSGQNKLAIAADWRQLTPDYAKSNSMSALVYSIAKELYSETGIPIGMIDTAVGGTAIALWRGDQSSNTWYASRIHPLRNMAISGIFWYQGCNDKDNTSEYYQKNMTSLINEYRTLFGNSTLPFYYVQLARNGSSYPATTQYKNQDTAGMKNVRSAQFDVYKNAANKTNLGIVSTLDIYGVYDAPNPLVTNGNFSARINYHTAQKSVVAHRLAAWALKDIYGMDKYKNNTEIYTRGPVYKSKTTDGNKLIVEFETNGNLKIMDKTQYADSITDDKITEGTVNPNIINEFEIAGADKEYKTAAATLNGNKIELTAEGITNPVSVRYAYSQYPESPNLTDNSNLPAYAFVSEAEKEYEPMKFDFGTGNENNGFTRISKSQAYGMNNKNYGFLGIDEKSADYKAVVDGYDQRNGNYTELIENNTSVKSANKQYPIRFAVGVEPNTYYKVKVTLSAQGGDAKTFLTSERRHFVLTEQEIKDGNTFTKEFTVAVHDVKWKNRDSGKGVPEKYTDNMLNICLLGENAALNSIEIQQISKPKVLWIFGDSTVTDHVTEVPVSHLSAEAGWGAAAAKYIKDDIAVVNLSEGGLAVSEKTYFDLAKDEISQGDVVMLQMGHNESSVEKYKSGLDYYYNATANAGAEFVLCSPIQRLSNSDSVNNIYTPAAKAYAESKNIPYVDLNCLTGNFNASLGDIKQWYTHVAYWQASADGASAFNDATHLNDYGADNTCRMAMEELKKLISGYVTDDMDAAIMPSDTIMKNGTNDYVMPPYKGNNAIFPYPENSDLEYEVEISDEAVNNGVLTAVKIKRNVQLSYITVFAAVYTKDGVLSDIMMKRLEPSAAGACETVELTDEERENGLSIPDGGKAAVFVWNGAFVDGSMDMKPLSEKYEIK